MARIEKIRKLPKIIFRDQHLLVVDKPSGWVTLYGSGKKTDLQAWVEEKGGLSQGNGLFKKRSGIVHRLDKDTSGLLLVAKNKEVFTLLQTLFSKRLIKKEYLALVEGEAPGGGIINAPIKRRRGEKKKWRVFPQGRESLTSFTREKLYFYQGRYYSLVKAKPLTGRTHQIRVHFQYLGFPLVSDPLYSSSKRERNPDRLFLHASALQLFHPVTKKRLLFQSSLPFKLKKHLKRLEEGRVK